MSKIVIVIYSLRCPTSSVYNSDEFGGMWKEATVHIFKVLAQNLTEGHGIKEEP
jgi:hypothetical protein